MSSGSVSPIGLRKTGTVPISSLLPADSPRSGENAEHLRLLSESTDPFPPILVDRRTLRVIDGMHRLNAAVLRGRTEMAVEFFDGTQLEAFIAAVEANVKHGLPLSLAERKEAALRIVAERRNWSNRALADITGLSPKTVAALRRRSSPDGTVVRVRIGKDGKARPISTSEGRSIAQSILRERPDASLRDVACAAGISPGTVRAVRREMDRPVDPEPVAPPSQGSVTKDQALTLRVLRSDPSVKLTTSGRQLLQLLSAQMLDSADWSRLADTVPPHCVPMVLELVQSLVNQWKAFGAELERRVCN